MVGRRGLGWGDPFEARRFLQCCFVVLLAIFLFGLELGGLAWFGVSLRHDGRLLLIRTSNLCTFARGCTEPVLQQPAPFKCSFQIGFGCCQGLESLRWARSFDLRSPSLTGCGGRPGLGDIGRWFGHDMSWQWFEWWESWGMLRVYFCFVSLSLMFLPRDHPTFMAPIWQWNKPEVSFELALPDTWPSSLGLT